MTDAADKASADWEAMAPYWRQVDTIMAGADAMREAGAEYLPKFPNETPKDYEFRCQSAKFTNVYRDIVESLASKPFARELTAGEGATGLDSLFDDIDGRGNSLHVFAGETFFSGINRAIDWILIDRPKGEGLQTVEDERRAGVRPYWVHVPAPAMLDVRSKIINGSEQFTYIKILQTPTSIREFKRDGDVVTWAVLEKNDKGEWNQASAGKLSIPFIPVVPFVTGRRKGSRWVFHPPMRDAADLQIELYQQESALKHIKTLTCFPMLAGNGVQPDLKADGTPKPVPVGPQAVLYAPPNADGSHGEWKWIVTDSGTLKFLADDVQETIRQLRELGRQPLTAQSGNLTKITTAVAAAKGNSAVQAWALQLQDALQQALYYTAQWMNSDAQPEVKVFTDFGVDALEDIGPKLLVEMWKGTGSEKAISGETLRAEMKRYGVLSPEFTEEREAERFLKELPGGDEEEEQPA